MVILNALHWSHSSTILGHFSPVYTLLKTHYTHTEQVNVNPDHFRSLHPQQTNHNYLFFLGENGQQCSHFHRPNETNMVQYCQTMFLNVSSQVSVLPNVSTLAYSCSKLFKSLLYLTVTKLYNIFLQDPQSVQTCSCTSCSIN